MKKYFLVVILVIGGLPQANAALYSVGNVNGSGTSLNQIISDGNPVGITSTMVLTGLGNGLSAISVTLNVSGGNNGDLYAFLSYGGTLVTLLNRVGTGMGDSIQQSYGYTTSGFNNVTLTDGSASNIHDVQVPGSAGSYSADAGSLASFNGVNPNGTWTLFFSDMSGGDTVTSTLNGWSLEITSVPEPVNVTLIAFGIVMLSSCIVRRLRRPRAA